MSAATHAPGDPESRPGTAPGTERLREPHHGFAGAAGWIRDFFSLVVSAGQRWSEDQCPRLGASLAYYALFSIFPLLLLAITGVGFFLGTGPGSRQEILGSLGSPSPELRMLLDQTLQSMQEHQTARGIGAVIGLVALGLGASGVFSELETSLDFIWRIHSKTAASLGDTVLGAIKAKAISFAVVIAAAVALLLSLGISTALGAIGTVAGRAAGASFSLFWSLVEAVVALGLLSLLFAAIYRIVPHTDVKWRDVFGAAFLTALLFTGLKWLFAWYLANLAGFAAYGAVGAVLGLLTWIYVSSLILFYGAEFSYVYAQRFGSASARSTISQV
jgi:membrane protein